jgi:CTP synthase (UTP-ammonia lyase)
VPSAREEYHCRYGLSREYSVRLANGPLRASAWDADGDVRAVELDGHPFFIATLFQPEQSALSGRTHPLIRAFVHAARHESGFSRT